MGANSLNDLMFSRIIFGIIEYAVGVVFGCRDVDT